MQRVTQAKPYKWPVCHVCGGEGHGLQWHWMGGETYFACSWHHLDIIGLTLRDRGGKLALTDMEILAIQRSKAQFADALDEAGVLHALNDLSVEQVEEIISKVWAACRANMEFVSIKGGAPF